jgi:PKD repeat protein
MKRQVKKALDILLLIFFVMSVTAVSVSASQVEASQKFMKTDFSANPISGHAPLEVHFYDHTKSHSHLLSWSWKFGDGKISSSQNPIHIYEHPGRYTVILTVKCHAGVTDTKKMSNYITVK